MKKTLLVTLALLIMLFTCGARIAPAEYSRADRTADVRIALVTDVSSVMDNGFNQAALQGIQTYSDGADIFYATYSTETDTADAYKDTILAAIQDNAELIVCAGPHFERAVGELQNEYSNVYFLLLDGVPKDVSGDFVTIAPNVHCITYREEEAGYLAGYMAVLEGYRKFGFIGGEQLPTVVRYENGYLQGIDDAIVSLGSNEEAEVRRWYADTFLANEETKEVSKEWYESGTEVIFACGGSLYESVLSSAEECDGLLIGVDADQSGISERFLTSAAKGIDSSVVVALDEFFANGKKWPEKLAGQAVSYGAREKCVSLPIQGSAWRFQTAGMDEYLRLLARLRTGEISIPVHEAALSAEKTIRVIDYDGNGSRSQEEKDS